jgi:hypothetical protein
VSAVTSATAMKVRSVRNGLAEPSAFRAA